MLGSLGGFRPIADINGLRLRSIDWRRSVVWHPSQRPCPLHGTGRIAYPMVIGHTE